MTAISRRKRSGSPTEELVDLLREVNRELREEIVRRGESEGFPRFSRRLPIAFEVLSEPGITVNELARRTRIPKSQASIIVGSLVADGLLRREGDARDQRLVRIFPTEAGAARFERWRSSYRSMLRSTVRALSEEEANDLLDGLRALHRVLSERSERATWGAAR
jgi:DNA-binding MarR family transcriptional regulator